MNSFSAHDQHEIYIFFMRKCAVDIAMNTWDNIQADLGKVIL